MGKPSCPPGSAKPKSRKDRFEEIQKRGKERAERFEKMRKREKERAERKKKYGTNWLGGTPAEIAKNKRIIKDLGKTAALEFKRKLRRERHVRIRPVPGGRKILASKMMRRGSTK